MLVPVPQGPPKGRAGFIDAYVGAWVVLLWSSVIIEGRAMSESQWSFPLIWLCLSSPKLVPSLLGLEKIGCLINFLLL